MSEAQKANEVIAGKSRRDLVTIILLVVIVSLLAWITYDRWQSQRRADLAEATTVSLAEQIQAACLDDAVIVSDQDVCERADRVVDDGPQGIAGERGERGPQGEPGLTGSPGRDGRPGLTGPSGQDGDDGAAGTPGTPGRTVIGAPGLTGADGLPGLDGTPGAPGVPGADGAPGTTGEDGTQGPPGATGPAGEIGPTGPTGAPGTPGADGRGVSALECQTDGTWLITYTDTTTSTTPGPCRIVDPTPEVNP